MTEVKLTIIADAVAYVEAGYMITYGVGLVHGIKDRKQALQWASWYRRCGFKVEFFPVYRRVYGESDESDVEGMLSAGGEVPIGK